MSSENPNGTTSDEPKQEKLPHTETPTKKRTKTKDKTENDTETKEHDSKQNDPKPSTAEPNQQSQTTSHEKSDNDEKSASVSNNNKNDSKGSDKKSESSDKATSSHSQSEKASHSRHDYHYTLPPTLKKPKSSKRFPVEEGTAVWSKIKVKLSANLKSVPKSRNSHTASVIGSNIWLFGGSNGEHCFNDLHVFDSHKRRWHTPHIKGIIPTPRFGHAAAVVNDQIFVIGGHEGDDPHQVLNDVYILDIDKMEWSRPKVHGFHPPPRSFHTVSVVGKNIFLFGGVNATHSLHDAFVFNTENNTWSIVSLEGIPILNRFIHTSFSVGNKVYVFSGNESREYFFNEVHILDTEKTVWTGHTFARGSEPCRRSGHAGSLIELNGRRYFLIFGGLGNSENLNDVELLDIDNLLWHKCVTSGRPPMPRYLHSVSVIGQAMFVFGGIGLKGRMLHDMPVLNFDGYQFDKENRNGTPNEVPKGESSRDKET
jgi:hypothetical protein